MAMEKKWIVKAPGDPACVSRISSELGIDYPLANLLVQRGIDTFEKAKEFFRPSLDNLYDPFLMKDMDKAVRRLDKALSGGEKILIYGDYDVDGTTAVALVFSYLRNFTKSLDFYIPDRYSEGYGISYKGIDFAAENGFSLVVALDCGIKSVEKVEYASSLGVDFIICDHHLADEEIPHACAVLNPKRHDCDYPFKELSGCGVGFKFMQAYAMYKDIPFESVLPLLDLVAVSIASDLVSVIGENRILAHYGLLRLNEAPRTGLKSIIRLSGLDAHSITIDDIVFKIGPRINAAGRMESGRTAVELLISRNENEARNIGNTINTHNNDRKSIDREITHDALRMVAEDPEFKSKKASVVYNPKWHKGVVGIVASRLVEAYYRPTIVLTKSNGLITGSARSIPGFDLYEAIESCADLLENFGGHMYAAGLTLKEENLERFGERFESFVAHKVTSELMTPFVIIDTYLDFKQITPKFFRILKQFQPFGPDNLSPVFISENVYDNGNGKKIGAGEGHLKLELVQEDRPFDYISAIAFNNSSHFEYMHAGNPVDICYTIAENYYRGIANMQLRIKDIRERGDFLDSKQP